MALTLDALLEPVSEDQPAGEDLAYDNERAELEQAFEREDSVGLDGDAGDAPERDWRNVLKLIERQFARSKDVWLAVYLARAGAETGALETVELGLQTLAGLFERYWPVVHPQLEELGVPGRKAPCESLANRRAFLTPLERTILIAHPRFGRFSGADVERFRSEGPSADGYGPFRATLEELGSAGLEEALARLDSMNDALHRADRAFMQGAPGEDSPNYAATYGLIAQLKTSLRSFLPDPAGEEGVDANVEGGAGPAAAGQRSLSGAVNSREDVVRVLELIATYYRQREPSHPMPLIIERAKLWVSMDYITLMRDIAPNGALEAEMILNTRPGLFE